MADDVSGVVVIGLVGTAIGVFAVDYAFSAKGSSWFDQIKGSLGGDSGGTPAPDDPEPSSPPTSLKQGGGILPHMQPSSLTVPVAPPSPAVIREVQARLNSMKLPSVPGVAHLPLKMDGLLGPDTQGFLVAMQNKWHLPTTAYPDSATIAMLRKMTASKIASARVPAKKGGAAGKGAAALAGDFEEIFAGAPALAPSWTAEIQKLGDHAANVISHAIASETDTKTLKLLGSNLQAAGYPLSSAAVLAKVSGAAVATTGWFPPSAWAWWE
jgi:hypothetical protein